MFKPIACLFLLCFSTAAFATADASRTRIALDKGDFESQRARIEAALADGKTYAEISQEDRATVRVARAIRPRGKPARARRRSSSRRISPRSSSWS